MRRENGSTISEQAIVDWFSYFRCVAEDHLVNNPILIGGPGKIVEIDETVFVKRKYGKGMFFLLF